MLNESYRKRYEELEKEIFNIVSGLSSMELRKDELVSLSE